MDEVITLQSKVEECQCKIEECRKLIDSQDVVISKLRVAIDRLERDIVFRSNNDTDSVDEYFT